MIKIVMMYDERAPHGAKTEAVNRANAIEQGYQFVCYRHMPHPDLNPFWNKFHVIEHELHDCDWLWWIDADAFFVRQSPLPGLERDIAFTTDWNGINSGVMAVRNCAWVQRLLQTWMFLGPVRSDRIAVFDDRQKEDQTTFKALSYLFKSVEQHVYQVPETIIQNPLSAFCASAIMLHTWAGWTGTKANAAAVDAVLAEGYTLQVQQMLTKR